MKKLMFALLGALVLVSCKPTVGGDDETTVSTPIGTSKGNEPEVVSNNSWVQVIADESSESGIAYFFIDSRVSNPLAELVADKKIKLEVQGTKTSNRADRYFGPTDNGAETIKVYKVFVNKDNVSDSIYLEDESLIATSDFGSSPFRFKISKNEDVWVMNIVNTVYDSSNDRALKFFNTYYE